MIKDEAKSGFTRCQISPKSINRYMFRKLQWSWRFPHYRFEVLTSYKRADTWRGNCADSHTHSSSPWVTTQWRYYSKPKESRNSPSHMSHFNELLAKLMWAVSFLMSSERVLHINCPGCLSVA
jgi:hypothetical protein